MMSVMSIVRPRRVRPAESLLVKEESKVTFSSSGWWMASPSSSPLSRGHPCQPVKRWFWKARMVITPAPEKLGREIGRFSLLFLKIDPPESAMRLDLKDSKMLLLTGADGQGEWHVTLRRRRRNFSKHLHEKRGRKC